MAPTMSLTMAPNMAIDALLATRWETLLVETGDAGASLRITINRPESLNALNSTVLAELETAFKTCAGNDSIRVVTIQGAGDKAFVAGADISEMRDLSPAAAREFALAGQRVTTLMESLPQIVIAQVGGFALGGGCELAMACDIIVASTQAKFGQPEVNLGLIPGFGGTQRLVKRVGLPVAMDLICSGRGRILKAAEALQAGLISRVVEPEKLNEEMEKLIASLLAAGPTAVKTCKRLIRDSAAMDLHAGLKAEADAFGHCWTVGESHEGMSAFLEKRQPAFDFKQAHP